jgi:hypothetical protein
MTQTLYACNNTQSTVAKNLLLVDEMVIDSSKSRKNLGFFETPTLYICIVRNTYNIGIDKRGGIIDFSSEGRNNIGVELY